VRARAAAAEALQAKVVDEAPRAQRLGGLLHSVWPRARHRPARPMPLPWTADIAEQTQPASCCDSTENCAIRSRLPHSTLASSSAAAGLAHGAALAQGCLPLRSCWVRATLIRTTAAIDTLQLSQLQLRFSKHLQCHASQRAYAMRHALTGARVEHMQARYVRASAPQRDLKAVAALRAQPQRVRHVLKVAQLHAAQGRVHRRQALRLDLPRAGHAALSRAGVGAFCTLTRRKHA